MLDAATLRPAFADKLISSGSMDAAPCLVISFSGGRTSGYMTKKILDTRSG